MADPKKTKKKKPEEVALSLMSRVNKVSDRIRIIEERLHFNREKIRIIDENSLSKFKELNKDFKDLNHEVIGLRKRIEELTVTVQRMTRELGRTAKMSDVEIIEKVLDFFDPASFLTEKDVIKLIKKEVDSSNGARSKEK